MLYCLSTLILVLVIISGWGQLVDFCLSRKRNSALYELLLKGTVALTLVFCGLAYFYRLNIFIETAVTLAGIICFFIFKLAQRYYTFIRSHPYGLVVMFCCTAAATFYPFILDHFGYYVPSIQWLNAEGLVRGIANLDLILGQMSFWHIFQAGFSNFADPYLRINLLASCILTLYIFEKRAYSLLLIVPFLLFFLQTPSPDLPCIAFSMMILNEILERRYSSQFLLVLATYLFAIKPTMLWPLLTLLFLNSGQFRKPDYWLPALGVAVVFILKNLWCFGYPIFPAALPNLAMPWAPNAEIMKTSSEIAIQKTYDMQYSMAEIQKFSAFDTVKNWLFLKGIKTFTNVGLILSLTGLGLMALKKKQTLITAIFFAVFIKCLLVLNFSAQYRFFMDVFFVVLILISDKKLHLQWSAAASLIGCVAVLVMLAAPAWLQKLVPSFRTAQFMYGFSSEQLWKPMNYGAGKFRTFKVGNLQFSAPKNYPFVYRTPLPAISPSYIQEYLDAGIFPQKAGKDLKNGLIWKKITEQERKNIQEILVNIGHAKKSESE